MVQAIRMRMPLLRHVVIVKLTTIPLHKHRSKTAITADEAHGEALSPVVPTNALGVSPASIVTADTKSDGVQSTRSSVRALNSNRPSATVALLPSTTTTNTAGQQHSSLKAPGTKGSTDNPDSKHQNEDGMRKSTCGVFLLHNYNVSVVQSMSFVILTRITHAVMYLLSAQCS